MYRVTPFGSSVVPLKTSLLEEPDCKHHLPHSTHASQVMADELPAELTKKLPRYPQLPVTLLGRLVVAQAQKGKGFGTFLLMDALHRSLTAAAEIAAMAIVVDAKDEAAEAFYQHFDFRPLQQQPTRLFLPMKIVAGLFPQWGGWSPNDHNPSA